MQCNYVFVECEIQGHCLKTQKHFRAFIKCLSFGKHSLETLFKLSSKGPLDPTSISWKVYSSSLEVGSIVRE